MTTENLPNANEIDPDGLDGPVQTRQGWVTPSSRSFYALRSKRQQMDGRHDAALTDETAVIEAYLRQKYAGDPARLAQIDAIPTPA